MTTPKPRHALTDSAALAAFANPARARILDALAVDGPSTASVLSERLGMAVGSASHHLKKLAEAGLVEEADGLSTDRRVRYWKLAHRQMRWSRRELTDASARSAAYEAEVLALQRQFDRARDHVLASEDDDTDTGAFATQNWLTLSAAELHDLSEQMVALLTDFQGREALDDGAERQPCLVFARGFPARP